MLIDVRQFRDVVIEDLGNFVRIALICTNHLCSNPRTAQKGKVKHGRIKGKYCKGREKFIRLEFNKQIVYLPNIFNFGDLSIPQLVKLLQLKLSSCADIIIRQCRDRSSRHSQWTMWPKLGEFPTFLRG